MGNNPPQNPNKILRKKLWYKYKLGNYATNRFTDNLNYQKSCSVSDSSVYPPIKILDPLVSTKGEAFTAPARQSMLQLHLQSNIPDAPVTPPKIWDAVWELQVPPPVSEHTGEPQPVSLSWNKLQLG